MNDNFDLINNQTHIIKNTVKDCYSCTPEMFVLHYDTLTCFRNTVPLTKHRRIVLVDGTQS